MAGSSAWTNEPPSLDGWNNRQKHQHDITIHVLPREGPKTLFVIHDNNNNNNNNIFTRMRTPTYNGSGDNGIMITWVIMIDMAMNRVHKIIAWPILSHMLCEECMNTRKYRLLHIIKCIFHLISVLVQKYLPFRKKLC